MRAIFMIPRSGRLASVVILFVMWSSSLTVIGCRERSEFSTPAELSSTKGNDVVVMSYNIAAHMKPDLDTLAREISAADADFVGLQEVETFTFRNFKNTAKQLAEKTHMHFVFEQARGEGIGRFGNAILSRWPIASHEVVRFPHVDSIPDPDGVCTSKYREQRIAIVAKVPTAPGGEVVFATTHMGHCVLEQKAAIETLAKKLDVKKRVILVGDFNAKLVAKDGTPGATAKLIMDQGFREAQTDPTQNLPQAITQRIDWIFHSSCWKAKSFSQGELTVSDHRPVWARLVPSSSCP